MSDTDVILIGQSGVEITMEKILIPCGGSAHLRYHELFDEADRKKAGDNAYIIVRDTTCRLFGYHGLLAESGAFSLDHMFGF